MVRSILRRSDSPYQRACVTGLRSTGSIGPAESCNRDLLLKSAHNQRMCVLISESLVGRQAILITGMASSSENPSDTVRTEAIFMPGLSVMGISISSAPHQVGQDMKYRASSG
ncbi:hypothetical protein VFPPC_18581 [Pochonia chlamydosporia 170]|uniref:Uncharacterized protein n=1 Tax=Pochonia chlamydosporia 170 TaxID=1380566 RepID=A0A219AN69_METCM|nr:hypothetical protein VFPPC_18581 [Pochonia chlamydosporia 170]OWT42288.1 hypothetical protein VFPPC_18581 [Pochonia chlamydosporia 170]